MKKKILNLAIICLLIATLFILTGCGNQSTIENESARDTNEIDDNVSKIVGTWKLNKNTKVNKSEYNNLHSLLGDSYGTDTLVINEDGTFTISAGMIYNFSGTYKFENDELSFHNIQDINIKNEAALADIEENLKLQYIEYNGNEFFKMFLYDFVDDYEAYVFYEKVKTNEVTTTYLDDEVPDIEFANPDPLENVETTNNTTNTSVSSKNQELIGIYTNNQSVTLEIIEKSDGTLYLKNGDKECKIDINETNPVVITISNVSSIIENATAAYIYPKGVGFSLSDNPANYEEGETDNTKYRIFVKQGNQADESNVYYK